MDDPREDNTVTAITAIVGAAFVVFQIIQIKPNLRNSTHERVTNEKLSDLEISIRRSMDV
jgi:hypothetical protein